MESNRLKIIGKSEFEIDSQLYKIVDFLNKTLKHKNLIFGLTYKDLKMSVTIYEE